ncbi:MAG: YkgJ family cysteine cluster protein, partial [Candidatus Omnitrophica bacterium]|nr:YkgJ family cysteine cluster protein [Candidatus Omnitrophota bacterium]
MAKVYMKKRAVRFNQFVPQEFCLKCQGCCRFAEADSVWAPCLLDEEIQDLLDNKELPAVMISLERRIRPVAHQGHENFLCPFLVMEDNACKIYDIRPFECQLY